MMNTGKTDFYGLISLSLIIIDASYKTQGSNMLWVGHYEISM